MSAHEALARHSIPASAALAALQRNQVDHVVSVPDWVQLALQWADQPPLQALHHLPATR